MPSVENVAQTRKIDPKCSSRCNKTQPRASPPEADPVSSRTEQKADPFGNFSKIVEAQPPQFTTMPQKGCFSGWLGLRRAGRGYGW